MADQLKSRDLSLDRSRCADTDCPCWKNDCARAEHQLGRMRFTWLALTRPTRARSCVRRIDPRTMEEKGKE